MTELAVTVTDLVRFCHRSGDIDHRFTPSPTGAQGIDGHQRLYARRPASYIREHPVEYRLEQPDLTLALRGRADGFDPQQGLVEEIKTCRVPPDSIPDEIARLHLAQGRLYAAMIATEQRIEQLAVRVTWLNIDSDEEVSNTETFSAGELAEFLDDTLARFAHWLRLQARLQQQRDASLAGLAFPLGEFRPGQRNIAELAYKCIDQGGQLLLEAPTGSGKTAAVMFPALKALATGKHDKLVFVTSKTVGKRTARDTLTQFSAAGYRGSSLTLTAKDSICLSPGRACHGDDCPYARGYYDRLPGAMQAAIEQDTLHREDLESLARRFEICPYELATDLTPWVDIIIADLNYVYSLTGSLGSMMEQDDKRWSVLLDEAHNLPGRARDMYSASLTKRDLMLAKKDAAGAVKRALARINRQLLVLQKASWQEQHFDSIESLPSALIHCLQGFSGAISEALAAEARFLQRHPHIMAFYFDVLQFLRVAEQWGPEYRCQLSRGDGQQSLRVELRCLDPARLLAQRQHRAHAVTAFSATLSPLPWSRSCLGLDEDAVCFQAGSPFSHKQLSVRLATDIDTRYRQRARTLPDLAGLLALWLQSTPGNCMIFFPSYQYLQDTLEQLGAEQLQGLGRSLWVQQRDQGDAEREELLKAMGEHRNIAAFCILGGVFSEGIDLPGEQLSSVVIVGIGMPQLNRDTRQLQAWYQASRGSGFEYAFLYPGMQKVDQALGRVVRRLEDRGSALLIDPRYKQEQYRRLLPPWWDYQPWPKG